MKLVLLISAIVILSLLMGGLYCGALAKFAEAIRTWFSDDDDNQDV